MRVFPILKKGKNNTLNIDVPHRLQTIFPLFLIFCTCLTSFAQSERYLELADSADYYISNKLWNKAEVKIMEALRLEPANFNNSLLLSNLGIIQIEKGDLEKAIDSFSLGISIAPSSTVLLNNRARAYLLKNDVDAAITDIDLSLSLDSIQEWPLQSRALIYTQNGDNNNAEYLFNKLQKNFPKNAIAYSGLGTLSVRKGDINSALQLFKFSLELNPEDEDTLVSYVFLLIEKEEYAEARRLLRGAIEKNPENGIFYLLRGYVHRRNYRPDEAQADKKTAIQKGINPSYASQYIP